MVKIALLRIKRFASEPDTDLPADAAQPHENAFLAPIQEKNARRVPETLSWRMFSKPAEAV